MDPSDDHLVHRVKDGDHEAFACLHLRHAGGLNRHVWAVVREDGAAEDLCQETFIRAWDRIGQLDEGASFRPWLYRIGTNLALNHIRNVKRRREDPLMPPSRLDEDDDQRIPDWLIDHTTSAPDARTLEREQEGAFRYLLSRLSEEKRETFRLAYDNELDTKEIAVRLGIPEGTVKSRVFHARRELADGWRTIFRDTEG